MTDYIQNKIQLEEAEKHIADALCNGETVTYGHGRYQTKIDISDVHEEIEHDKTLYPKFCDLTIAILQGDSGCADKLKGLYRMAAEKVAYSHADEYMAYTQEQQVLDGQISNHEWQQGMSYLLVPQAD